MLGIKRVFESVKGTMCMCVELVKGTLKSVTNLVSPSTFFFPSPHYLLKLFSNRNTQFVSFEQNQVFNPYLKGLDDFVKRIV